MDQLTSKNKYDLEDRTARLAEEVIKLMKTIKVTPGEHENHSANSCIS